MKRKYIEDNNIVEKHLLNKLSDEERKAFRAALLFDEELRQEVEDTRLLHQQIKQLKPQTGISSNKLNKKIWLIFAFIIGALLISFFYYNTTLKKEVETKSTIESSSSNEESNNQNLDAQKGNLEEETPNVEEIPNNTAPVPPVKTEEQPNINQPIAAADIAPHPYLDQFTRSAVRNNETLVEVNNPKQGQTIELKEGKAKIEVKGRFITKKEVSNKRYTIRLFSNKKADFDAFKPIISVYPTLRKSSDGYEFNAQNIVPFKRGLYYFVIEDTKLENMVYVGKFFVK